MVVKKSIQAKKKKESIKSSSKKNSKSVKQNDKKLNNNISDGFVVWLIKKFPATINFRGSWVFLVLLLLFGILFPPAMSFGIMYFVYRSFPKRPKLFDRNILIFSFSMLLISFVSLSLIGIGFEQVLSMTVSSTIVTMLLGYPFVFAWLWFDWNYGLNSDRKQ